MPYRRTNWLLITLCLTMMMNACNGQTQAPVVRPATQANRFYTGDAQALSEEVDSFLALHKGRVEKEHVAALFVPHAGYYFSGNVAASAYMSINPKNLEDYLELTRADIVIPQAKKLSTHMLVTRSRKTKDVVLMFNRQRGIEVKFKPGSNGLLFNNVELCNKLIELLELDTDQEYFQLGIELLDETKDYLLFLLKRK